jgi:hypothetical protein
VDDRRFDAIVRMLDAIQTRRGTMRGAAALLGLGLLADPETGEARKRRRRRGKRKRCRGGTSRCNNRCVDTRTDRNNCGACFKDCDDDEACIDGECVEVRVCPAGEEFCQIAQPLPCGGRDTCFCSTGSGATICGDITRAVCSTLGNLCEVDTDCDSVTGPGSVCNLVDDFCTCNVGGPQGFKGCVPRCIGAPPPERRASRGLGRVRHGAA